MRVERVKNMIYKKLHTQLRRTGLWITQRRESDLDHTDTYRLIN